MSNLSAPGRLWLGHRPMHTGQGSSTTTRNPPQLVRYAAMRKSGAGQRRSSGLRGHSTYLIKVCMSTGAGQWWHTSGEPLLVKTAGIAPTLQRIGCAAISVFDRIEYHHRNFAFRRCLVIRIRRVVFDHSFPELLAFGAFSNPRYCIALLAGDLQVHPGIRFQV